MKNLFLLCLFLCSSSYYLGAQELKSSVAPLIIGEVHTIHSTILGEDRVLNIYAPPDYNPNKKYPVIYLLDGSMNEDFLHITGLVQFFNLMYQMPQAIIVGIANVDRKRDFTFHTELKDLQRDYPTTGHSDRFIDFLEKELLPYIAGHFSTSADRYLIGQSLGGLLGSEVLLTRPQLFTHYLLISPSLWWDDESLLTRAPELLKKMKATPPKYIYISVGAGESKIMIRDAKKMSDLIRKETGVKTTYNIVKDVNHATILHLSIYKALEELFPYKE